jgi:hypothetical protein
MFITFLFNVCEEGLGHSRGFLLRFSNSQKPHSLDLHSGARTIVRLRAPSVQVPHCPHKQKGPNVLHCGLMFVGGTWPRTFFVAVASKNFSALLVRPIVLDGYPALVFKSLIALQTKKQECLSHSCLMFVKRDLVTLVGFCFVFQTHKNLTRLTSTRALGLSSGFARPRFKSLIVRTNKKAPMFCIVA